MHVVGHVATRSSRGATHVESDYDGDDTKVATVTSRFQKNIELNEVEPYSEYDDFEVIFNF